MIKIILMRDLKRQLKGRDRLIIRLYYDYGYREREIGQMLGLHRVTINRLKQRALQRMRE